MSRCVDAVVHSVALCCLHCRICYLLTALNGMTDVNVLNFPRLPVRIANKV